jgi:hypothetical protein
MPPHLQGSLAFLELDEVDSVAPLSVIPEGGKPWSLRITDIELKLGDAFVADEQVPDFTVLSPDWGFRARHVFFLFLDCWRLDHRASMRFSTTDAPRVNPLAAALATDKIARRSALLQRNGLCRF